MKRVLAVIMLFSIAIMVNVVFSHAEDAMTSPLPAKSLTGVQVLITTVQGGFQVTTQEGFSDNSTRTEQEPVKTLDEGIDRGLRWLNGEKSLPIPEAAKKPDKPKK